MHTHTHPHTYIQKHTRPVSCPVMSRGHWPPLSCTSCVPPTSVPRGLYADNSLHLCLLTILLLQTVSSSLISYPRYFLPHYNVPLRSAQNWQEILCISTDIWRELKPFLISFICKTCTYLLEQHSAMWVGLIMYSDTIVHGKHHP